LRSPLGALRTTVHGSVKGVGGSRTTRIATSEGTLTTVSFRDGEGKRLKTQYFGRVPESGKATKRHLAATVAQVRDLRPDIRVAAIADGRRQLNIPEGDRLRRPRPRLPACLPASRRRFGPYCQSRLVQGLPRDAARRTRRGGKVIRSLRCYPGRAKEPRARAPVRRFLNSVVKNRIRMRYSELRAERLAIGSGAVEAVNKTLVAARMKRSGMRWHIKSGQAIPGFRALQKSGFLASAWAIMMEKGGAVANNNFAVENLAIAARKFTPSRHRAGFTITESHPRATVESRLENPSPTGKDGNWNVTSYA